MSKPVFGLLLGGFLGRKMYQRTERLITRLPIFKQVYPYVKQVVDFLFSDEKQMKINRVVMVQYPRKGIWSIGFQTGGPMRSAAAQAGDSVTVFIPCSPTPVRPASAGLPASSGRGSSIASTATRAGS